LVSTGPAQSWPGQGSLWSGISEQRGATHRGTQGVEKHLDTEKSLPEQELFADHHAHPMLSSPACHPAFVQSVVSAWCHQAGCVGKVLATALRGTQTTAGLEMD